jgi:D-alanyl-D-alanine carboxypeptidase (penicillin-binding protein 5/6)
MKNFSSLFAAIILVTLLSASPTLAKEFETKARQAILLEVNSDTTLFSKDAEGRMFPSSMTKLLTTYLIFEKLKQGALRLDSEIYISEGAWRTQGSKMFVKVGDYVKVEDLLRGIIIQSGNDACVAVAEALAGSEEGFARLMNAKAEAFGLRDSHFMNSNGWPDPSHYTTARDLAVIAQRLVQDFPEYHHYWAEKEYTYNNIRQFNRNRLLGELGVDGLKTGHTEIAGYGVTVSSLQPDGRRFILVVNGLKSEKERTEEARKLLQYGIYQFAMTTLAKPGQAVAKVKTWFGKQPEVALTVDAPLQYLLPVGQDKNISVKAKLMEPVPTPLPAKAKAGDLLVTVNGETKTYPLYTTQAVEQLEAGDRFFPSLKYRLFGTP